MKNNTIQPTTTNKEEVHNCQQSGQISKATMTEEQIKQSLTSIIPGTILNNNDNEIVGLSNNKTVACKYCLLSTDKQVLINKDVEILTVHTETNYIVNCDICEFLIPLNYTDIESEEDRETIKQHIRY